MKNCEPSGYKRNKLQYFGRILDLNQVRGMKKYVVRDICDMAKA
jgi:hypothetical protein